MPASYHVRSRPKYGAKPTLYAGRRYHSAAEAAYAAQLDMLKAAGEIRSWEPQVAVELKVGGQLVCRYVADFKVTLPDGSDEYHEVKGCSTAIWRLKRKLLAACRPDIVLRIVDV